MTVALIDSRVVIAASPEFLARLGLRDLDDLVGRGGLAFLAPGMTDVLQPQRVRLALPEGLPAEAEILPLVTGAAGRPLLAIRLLPAAPEADWPFLARLSHELRTPLTSVIGFAELMETERLAPLGHDSYRGYVADILTSARHTLALVNDLLDIAKIRAGRSDAVPAQLDPAALAREAVAAMEPRAMAAGVTLELTVQGAPMDVRADRRGIMQILLNLLANALRWTPRGGRVTVLVTHDPAARPAIEVIDTGPGMSAEALAATLADPFGPGRAGRPAGGSGLGIPLARELAATNGAALAFDTAPGKGMRVRLQFASGTLREIKAAP
jgi:signal transduction histidine kinase